MEKKDCKILILTCLWKRHDVFEVFKEKIRILQSKYNIDLLVVGSEGEISKSLCSEFHYVEAPNQPLSNKWNEGIKYAKDLEWDYIMILGSDDIINDLQFYYDCISEGYNFVGALDCWTYNIYTDKIYYFAGYTNHRRGESVGAGRLISRGIIEQMNYELWNTGLKSSLDYSFEQKLNSISGIKKKTYIGKDEGIINLGIYTNDNITQICMFKKDDLQKIDKEETFLYFDKKIISKINILKRNICLVIIPVYNEERKIKRCINSVLAQTYRDIRIIIINDCSTDRTIDIIKEYKDDRIVLYKNHTNKGVYNSINTVLQNEKDYDCFMIQGADDVMVKTRVEEQFIKYNDRYMATLCMYRRRTEPGEILTDECYGHSMLCYSRRIFDELGYFDNTRFAGDTEYWLRFYRKYGESKLKKIPQILYIAYSSENSLTNKIYPIGGEERRNYCIAFEQEHLLMEKKKNYYRSFIDKDRVIVSMAAVPDREESLKDTVESIIDQCDELHIYLNEWDEVPQFLKNNYKIKYYESRHEVGDIGDVGKFFGLQGMTGYCFTIDDDLIYPKDYIATAIEGIKKYWEPVSFHGKIFSEPPIDNYHGGSIIENFRCQNVVGKDRSVHIIGTGCFAFHTDIIRYDIKDFENINMSDIYASIIAHKKNHFMWVLKHRERFLLESEKVDYDNSIWYKNHQHGEIQTELINENYKYFNLFVEHIKENTNFVETIKEEKDESIYMNITIGDNKMTLVKTIVIKEKDGNEKFGTLGTIMPLEQSTANVLIEKGLVAIYNKDLEAELMKSVNNIILKDAMGEKVDSEVKEDKELTETNEDKTDTETNEDKEASETKEDKEESENKIEKDKENDGTKKITLKKQNGERIRSLSGKKKK
jgi:glycosyltransferase involved in cell wall biosynthesis